MGWLIYGTLRLPVADHTLAHFQIVLDLKMRRNECFLLRARIPVHDGGGRISLWISPQIPVLLDYESHAAIRVNRAWVSDLLAASHSNRGLELVDGPRTPEGTAP